VETAPNTTTTAAAGTDEDDPTLLPLTDATGFPTDGSRQFRLEAANGDVEMVSPVGVSGSTVRLRAPLANQYATGATFKSTRIQATIDATWVAAEDNLATEDELDARYRVIWVFTVGGVQKRRAGLFDLVRYTSSHNVTPLDVDGAFAGWIDRLPTNYRREQGRPLIDEAWREVRMDLRADRKLGRWLRNVDVMTELICARANLASFEHRAMFGGQVDPDALKAARDLYQRRYDQLIREPKTTIGTQPMGGVVPSRRVPLFSR